LDSQEEILFPASRVDDLPPDTATICPSSFFEVEAIPSSSLTLEERLLIAFALVARGFAPPPLLLTMALTFTVPTEEEEEGGIELTEKRSRPAMSRAARFASMSDEAERPSVLAHSSSPPPPPPPPCPFSEEDTLVDARFGWR